MLDGQAKYDSYKDSGEIWLGAIPSDWNLECIRAVTELKSKRGEPDLPVLSVYRDYGVILKDSRDDNHNATSLDTSNYKVVAPGDLVVNKMKAWQGSMGVSQHEGIVSPAYITCRTDPDKIAPRFLHYTLRSQPFIAVYNSLSYGVRIGQWDMHYEDFKKIPLAYPDLDTQNRIVSFLDEKTAEIDAAVEKKRRLIDLLNEQKAILINSAVTKGLNPNAPMKDSGVDWIGEIPAHWDVKRNAAMFEQTKKSGTADLPVLSVSIHHGVSREELSEEENLRSAIKIADRTSYVEVLPGYIAYNMMRAWQGGIGAVHTHGMVSPAYVVAPPFGQMDAEYFERLYRTKLFIDQMDQYSKGITDFRKRLYWEEFKVLLTLVPPIGEQIEVAAFCGKIDDACKDAVSATEREIAFLYEFKQTLIANAVTGKIKI